jgi:NDP-sugar pyrophosphorylase family protein
MEGMILAAGAGTRLGPLTSDLPKALVSVGGKPLLGWVAERMAQAGVKRIIVNTHHHEEQIRAYLRDFSLPGVSFVLSPEPGGPFETGGGLIRAAHLFQEEAPFLLHNADVLSTIPLGALVARHKEADAGAGKPLLASLAVQRREARRQLLFDDLGLLGWENRGSDRGPEGRVEVREPTGEVRGWAFTGIHVVDPEIFRLSQRAGSFSIVTLYLELAKAGWPIHPLDVTEEEWFDIGTPERLEEARTRFS